jgi:hypothetical protein
MIHQDYHILVNLMSLKRNTRESHMTSIPPSTQRIQVTESRATYPTVAKNAPFQLHRCENQKKKENTKRNKELAIRQETDQ